MALVEQPPQKLKAPDYYYHWLALAEQEAAEEWERAASEAALIGEKNHWGLLQLAAHDSALSPGVSFQATRAFHQGRFFYYADQWGAALAQYQLAWGLYQQVGDRLGEANTRKAIGDVQRFQDDLPAALQSYNQALALFSLVQDRLGEANCYNSLGLTAYTQQQYPQALDFYARAEALYQAIDDNYSQMVVCRYRSYAYDAMGNRHLAIQDMEKAVHIAQRLKMPQLEPYRQRLEALRRGSK